MAYRTNSLQSLLGIEVPIIQAPMAGAQDSAMTVAVCNAGGLGSLPCAMLGLDEMRTELAAIRSQTSKPFNVNFFTYAESMPDPVREAAWRQRMGPYYRELDIDPEVTPSAPQRVAFNADALEVLAEFKPPVVSFHFGLPTSEMLARIHGWGAKILSSATTVEEALWLEAHGVDIIIAQGFEAGGHRGMFLTDDLTTQIGTFALLPQVLQAVKVPVVAAGGIATAMGVSAAIALGAAGVQIGTAYLLCPESTITPTHRAALKSAAARHTALTNVFTGRPARAIVNRLIKELGPMNPAAPAFPFAATAIAPLRARSNSAGNPDFVPMWCGQNASGCKEISAAELTRELGGEI